MVTPFIQARDNFSVYMDRIVNAFSALYDGIPKPKYFDGLPVNEPNCYISLDTVTETHTVDPSETAGGVAYKFSLHVYACAKHQKQEVSANAVMTYVDAISSCVAADPTIGGAVDIAQTRVEAAGISPDPAKYYLAAASVEVSCTVFLKSTKKLLEVMKGES